jgi:hypothetical protein
LAVDWIGSVYRRRAEVMPILPLLLMLPPKYSRPRRVCTLGHGQSNRCIQMLTSRQNTTSTARDIVAECGRHMAPSNVHRRSLHVVNLSLVQVLWLHVVCLLFIRLHPPRPKGPNGARIRCPMLVMLGCRHSDALDCRQAIPGAITAWIRASSGDGSEQIYPST